MNIAKALHELIGNKVGISEESIKIEVNEHFKSSKIVFETFLFFFISFLFSMVTSSGAFGLILFFSAYLFSTFCIDLDMLFYVDKGEQKSGKYTKFLPYIKYTSALLPIFPVIFYVFFEKREIINELRENVERKKRFWHNGDSLLAYVLSMFLFSNILFGANMGAIITLMSLLGYSTHLITDFQPKLFQN